MNTFTIYTIFKPAKPYPDVLFSAIKFIEEIREYLEVFDQTKILLIDLSDNISVTSRCVELILHSLNKIGIDKIFFNLSGTSIDGNIFAILFEDQNIKEVNICNTEAAMNGYLDKLTNILRILTSRRFIFVSETDIQYLDGMDKCIILDHIDYYSKLY